MTLKSGALAFASFFTLTLGASACAGGEKSDAETASARRPPPADRVVQIRWYGPHSDVCVDLLCYTADVINGQYARSATDSAWVVDSETGWTRGESFMVTNNQARALQDLMSTQVTNVKDFGMRGPVEDQIRRLADYFMGGVCVGYSKTHFNRMKEKIKNKVYPP